MEEMSYMLKEKDREHGRQIAEAQQCVERLVHALEDSWATQTRVQAEYLALRASVLEFARTAEEIGQESQDRLEKLLTSPVAAEPLAIRLEAAELVCMEAERLVPMPPRLNYLLQHWRIQRERG